MRCRVKRAAGAASKPCKESRSRVGCFTTAAHVKWSNQVVRMGRVWEAGLRQLRADGGCTLHRPAGAATSYVPPPWPRRRLSPGANCIALASSTSAASLPCAPSSAAASSLLLLLLPLPPSPWPLCPLAPPGGVSGCTPQAWAGAEGCAGTAACAAAAGGSAAGGSAASAGHADVQARNVSSG